MDALNQICAKQHRSLILSIYKTCRFTVLELTAITITLLMAVMNVTVLG